MALGYEQLLSRREPIYVRRPLGPAHRPEAAQIAQGQRAVAFASEAIEHRDHRRRWAIKHSRGQPRLDGWASVVGVVADAPERRLDLCLLLIDGEK